MFEEIILITLAMSFFITTFLSPFFIPILRKLKFGQSIRDEGPKSHQKKIGTPTMGGIMIVLSIIITTIAVILKFSYVSTELYILIFVTLSYGFLGFLDDFIKVVMKRNLGLTSKQKLTGQIFIAIVFFLLYRQIGLPTSLTIPNMNIEFELNFLYFFIIVLWLVGFSNAVNLTDGLDGLLSGVAALAFGAFAIISWYQEQYDMAVFSVAVVGAVLGFLMFNAHPAKVFMGDTGSLALGGALATVSIFTRLEILLILIGGVFVIETLSVIIQVLSFKITGKRVFKMSPLHHHYELLGWSEWRIVTTFWFVGFIFAIIGTYIGVWL